MIALDNAELFQKVLKDSDRKKLRLELLILSLPQMVPSSMDLVPRDPVRVYNMVTGLRR